MGLLHIVDQTETTQIDGEDGDFVIVRTNLTKRDMNTIVRGIPRSAMTEEGDNLEMALQTPEVLFGVLVTGWSLDVPPTVENYGLLPPEATNWLDGVLLEHFNSMSLTKEESGKRSTSPRGQRKATPATE